MKEAPSMLGQDATAIEIECRDGVRLGGHLWLGKTDGANGSVIINAATGVVARYYHRYARFLTAHNFDVLTYDYRGIGASRPADIRRCGHRWRDWGERDFDAVLRFMHERRPRDPLIVVGHSIGGFLPGLAESAPLIGRMLTVGAQYAWWGDYARGRRAPLLLKWHVTMPALTMLFGHFPGRRLGWLEDLPPGVAYEWSFRGPRFERSHPPEERAAAVSRMAAVTAPTLAVAISDDELGTIAAVRRTLSYYAGADRTAVLLEPLYYSRTRIGHFGLFHDSHANGFWLDTVPWLLGGPNPWPSNVVPLGCRVPRAI